MATRVITEKTTTWIYLPVRSVGITSIFFDYLENHEKYGKHIVRKISYVSLSSLQELFKAHFASADI
jgi:hypothetical protein